MVPPERFELPAPAFVAQCSNPNELRWCIEFESSCPIVIATIHPCNKAGRDSVRHLGYLSNVSIFCHCQGFAPPVVYTSKTFEESIVA